jgi:hypothetical protein
VGGRFNPAKNALVFSSDGGLEQPLTAEERRRYQKRLGDLLLTFPDEKPGPEGTSWQQFQEKAQPGLDSFGRPVLQTAIADKVVALGISRGSFLSNEAPSELRREFLVTRVRAELAAGRAPRISRIELLEDWELLQKIVAARSDGAAVHAEIGNWGTQNTSLLN